MNGPEKLTATDESFLLLDSPTTSQNIASLCILNSSPNSKELITRWNSVLEIFPKLRMVITPTRQKVRGRKKTILEWRESKQFAVADHLKRIELPPNSTRKDLFQAISSEFSTPLPLDRPLWKQVLFDNGAESALLTIYNHALTDGLGALEVVHTLSSPKLPDPPTERIPLNRSFSFRSALKALRREIFAKRGVPSLCGVNSPYRSLNGTSLPLSTIRELRDSFQASHNDIFLALITRSVALTLRTSSERYSPPRVIIPVSLRDRRARLELGNYLTGVSITLPIHLDTPEEIISEIKAQTAAIKSERLAESYAAIGDLGRFLPARYRARFCNALAVRTACIATNMPESQRPRSIAGAEITAHFGYPALMEGHGFGFGCISYNKQAFFSLITDDAIIPDSLPLLNGMEAAASEFLHIARRSLKLASMKG